MKIRKAVIPAAGIGTRFLPATKAQPKEMLPIVDTPTIQFVVEEAVKAGIKDILIITGKGKRAIEDHFDEAFELEHFLEQKGKIKDLEEVRRIANLADIHFIRQKGQKGLGDAIMYAKEHVGDEPFAVLLGDSLIEGEKPVISELMEAFKKTKSSIMGVEQVPKEKVSRYGIIKPSGEMEDSIVEVKDLVEK
ncbi:NTP transferase domain-containing protein, partial [Candidatus Woesearchaeota archaeon]|nr:NTP transferase domain-containing protein [Candidatus Woesearchaeota archaeon]